MLALQYGLKMGNGSAWGRVLGAWGHPKGGKKDTQPLPCHLSSIFILTYVMQSLTLFH